LKKAFILILCILSLVFSIYSIYWAIVVLTQGIQDWLRYKTPDNLGIGIGVAIIVGRALPSIGLAIFCIVKLRPKKGFQEIFEKIASSE